MKVNERLLLCLCENCASQFYYSTEHIIKSIDPKRKPNKLCVYCDVENGVDFEITKTKKFKNM